MLDFQGTTGFLPRINVSLMDGLPWGVAGHSEVGLGMLQADLRCRCSQGLALSDAHNEGHRVWWVDMWTGYSVVGARKS